MTSTNDNKAIVEEFFERINAQDLGVFDELCADGFAVEIDRQGAETSAIGVDGVKAMFEEYFDAFPDFQYDIVEMVAEGDHVAVFMRSRGTHEGEFRGVPATGNTVEIDDMGLLRLQDGEIVDMWPQSDMLGLFEQLGRSLDL